MIGRTALVVALFSVALFLVKCSGEQEQSGKQQEQSSEQETSSEALTTDEQTGQADESSEEASSSPPEGRSPEETLALQYEYINKGDFEKAYSLFAEQSRREVSSEQYRVFFEVNAPYSVTDYSFSPAQTQGDSATVDTVFTANSVVGSERLQRTQRFVLENGEWRVVMRPDQVAIFTAIGDAGGSLEQPPPPPEGEDKASKQAQPQQPQAPALGQDLYDCEDFQYQEDAQALYEQDTSDPYGLDGPQGEASTGTPGVACEELPNRTPNGKQKQRDTPTPILEPTPPPPPPSSSRDGSSPPVSGNACPPDAPIKGNQSGIYHVPGGQFYDRTNPEECFASEEDAQAAGYRKSQR